MGGVCLDCSAMVSPLYVNQKPVTEPEVEEQSMVASSSLRLLLLLLITAFGFLLYLNRTFTRYDRGWNSSGRSFLFERQVAIGLIVVGVVSSPLYINRTTDSEPESNELPISFASWLPLLLLMLMLVIALSLYCGKSFTKFDPDWIHRTGGSSA